MDFVNVKINLEKQGYKVSRFESAGEAADYPDSQIDNKTAGFGGSVTLEQIGLYARLLIYNTVRWHWRLPRGRTDKDMRLEAKEAEIYVSSVNGLAKTGETVNIDGNCNRVAEIFYGHEKVYLPAGRNKVEESLDSALYRARNVAALMNARRIGAKTPCAVKDDRCYYCKCDERICCGLSVLWKEPMSGEFEVVPINEIILKKARLY